MCERHIRLYREAAELLERYRWLQEEITKEPSTEVVIDFLLTSCPPGVDRIHDHTIRKQLVEKMARANPPFPVGKPYRWLVEMTQLLKENPGDQMLLQQMEYLEQLVSNSEPGWHSTVKLYLARAYVDAERYIDAVRAFRKCAVVPLNDLRLFAIALVEIGEYEEAVQIFDSDTRLSSGRSSYASRIALALESVGRTDDAVKILKKAAAPAYFEPLPDSFVSKFDQLLREEKDIISARFGFAGWWPQNYKDICGGDVEYVKHVEEEAMKKLGMTYEELMSIYHPGKVHNEDAPSIKERSAKIVEFADGLSTPEVRPE